MAQQLPWETNSFMPWMVGQTFVGADGATYQTYADPASQTGYTAKRRDANGESFVAINAPRDLVKEYAWIEDPNNPYGRRLVAQEAAAADQNTFNRGIAQGGLDVQRQNADTNYYSAQTSRLTAEANAAAIRAQIEQAKKDLQFRYYQQNQNNQMARGQLGLETLKVGSSLTGPRNWDRYLETAAAAGRNPMLQGAVGTWASLTGQRPNTGAVNGPLPQKFDLNALASDFSGQGASGQAGQRIAALDTVAMNPGQAQPGWWQGLSSDEKERAKGYWETNGWSPSSVLNSLAWTQPNQGLGYGGA